MKSLANEGACGGTTSHHQFKYPDSNKLGYHHSNVALRRPLQDPTRTATGRRVFGLQKGRGVSNRIRVEVQGVGGGGYKCSTGGADKSMRNKGAISLRISGRQRSSRNVIRSSCRGCPKTIL